MTPLLSILVACTAPSAPEPEPEAPAPEAPAPEAEPEMDHPGPDWTVKKHMNKHFAHVTDALYFTFEGDLEGLKGEAAELAKHETMPDAPEAWEPYLETMRKESEKLAAVESIEDGAKGLVGLATACAACHKANKGPDVTQKDLLTNPELFGDEAMDRHQWAAYLLWIGLVVPDDEIWTAGTRALGHDKGALPPIPEEAKALEMRVHDLGAKAASAETAPQRGAAFAELLTTCSECHTKLDVPFR